MTSLLTPDARIYVAGHGGLVGSAVWRELAARGHQNLIGWRSHELDLRRSDDVHDAMATAKPDVVVVAAARVGGILANSTQPVDFLNDNLRIQTNLFEAAHANDVDRLLFLGSSCIYPKLAPQPIPESALLTGPLEVTNQSYAIAKIAGIMAVQAYRTQFGRRWISAMPTNLYGPNDNFDLTTAHVLPALVRRLDEARREGAPTVTVWGTGTPRREFLHTDDLARALYLLLTTFDETEHINVGTGEDITIRELAMMIQSVVGYEGTIEWDTNRPDGTPRKQLDITRLSELGWRPQVSLEAGLSRTFQWYSQHREGAPR